MQCSICLIYHCSKLLNPIYHTHHMASPTHHHNTHYHNTYTTPPPLRPSFLPPWCFIPTYLPHTQTHLSTHVHTRTYFERNRYRSNNYTYSFIAYYSHIFLGVYLHKQNDRLYRTDWQTKLH